MLYPSASCLAKGEEEIKVTLLQKKRNQLAGYCKLVTYGVLDLVAATDVFKYYNKVERMDTNGSRNILTNLFLFWPFISAVHKMCAWIRNIKEDV